MASCEMCGTECPTCRPALIDGVKMMVCPACMKHGTPLVQQRSSPMQKKKPFSGPSKPYTSPKRDVFKKMEKELVSDWSERIKSAREKKQLTREQLGFRIGERTVTIAKIENEDLRPSDKIIQKIEKELEITLMEEVSKVSTAEKRSIGSGSRLTLGDFIKEE